MYSVIALGQLVKTTTISASLPLFAKITLVHFTAFNKIFVDGVTSVLRTPPSCAQNARVTRTEKKYLVKK
jgi:hypothetical protein